MTNLHDIPLLSLKINVVFAEQFNYLCDQQTASFWNGNKQSSLKQIGSYFSLLALLRGKIYTKGSSDNNTNSDETSYLCCWRLVCPLMVFLALVMPVQLDLEFTYFFEQHHVICSSFIKLKLFSSFSCYDHEVIEIKTGETSNNKKVTVLIFSTYPLACKDWKTVVEKYPCFSSGLVHFFTLNLP